MTHPVQATGEGAQGVGRPQTLGAYRVGISFNPSGDARVNAIKAMAASFIDLCEMYRDLAAASDSETKAEVNRLLALAETHIEDAAMWAVKAVTKPPRG